MLDPSAQSFTRMAVQTVGVDVTFSRLTGYAPRVVSFEASLVAIVRAVAPDSEVESRTGLSASRPGAVTQDDRQVIVMVQDLTDASFPLPVVKGDRIKIVSSGEEFNVTKVDGYRRDLAGAVELTVSGVS